MAKRLGKGLSELLKNIEEDNTGIKKENYDSDSILNVDIADVYPNINQPRKYFDDNSLQELAESIRVHGIIQPLVVSQKGSKFVIIAGERRFRASKMIGLDKIPVIVKDYDEQQIREVSLIENLQREDLNAIEEAEALRELIDNYKLTQEALAGRIGKSRSNVANILRLLSLPKEVKELVKADRLSQGHARALLTISDRDLLLEFAYAAMDNKLSVRALEQKIRLRLAPKDNSGKKTKIKLTLELKGLIDDMNRIFSTKVRVIGNESKGRFYIDYYTNDDLQRIYELMETLKKEKRDKEK